MFQTAQARVAGSEIIDFDDHTVRAQSLQCCRVPRHILHQTALGNLQSQMLRPASLLLQNLANAAPDPRAVELHGRDVDSNRNHWNPGLLPTSNLRAGTAEYELTDGHDQACLLGNGNEFGR